MSAHDCVARINALLVERNTQISTGISFSEPARELIQVGTAKLDPGKRGKPITFYATFCPFCGQKLGSAA